jgi:apolipoprotein N-acyltransferase
VPLFVSLAPDDGRPARTLNFAIGYLSGFTAIFSLFFWLTDTITTFSNIPMGASLAILGLFSAVWGLPYGLLAALLPLLERRFGRWYVLLFPCVWVASEFLQPALFPYYQGVGQYRTPWTWQLASVFGAMGLSWLVIASNLALASVGRAFLHRGPRPWLPVAIVLALFLGNLGFGAWRYRATSEAIAAAPRLRASMLQEGVTMVTRLQDRGDVVLQSWIDLTAKVLPERPDLVVWPEGSIYGNPSSGKLNRILGEVARQSHAHLLLGGGTSERDPENRERNLYWNSCYLFEPSGTVQARYDKMVPLPFGEYLPWPISYLRPYIEGVGNFRAGEQPQVFEVHTDRQLKPDGSGVRFSTPICYEAILESQMRRLMDVDVFVNITNDGWFGDTAAPHQHAMLAAVHAVELGRPMLRIAYTGISMVIDPNGDIREETAPYTQATKVVEVPIVAFETPYRSWGRLFPWIASLVGAWAAAMAWTSRPRGVTPPLPGS